MGVGVGAGAGAGAGVGVGVGAGVGVGVGAGAGAGAAGTLAALPGFVPPLISAMLVAPSPSESSDSMAWKLWPAFAKSVP